MTPAQHADRLRATVDSAGGTVLTDRPDWWTVKGSDGVTLAEIGNQKTVTRLNYKGPDVTPALAELVQAYALEYATPPGERPTWPGGGFRVTDETVESHCAVLSAIVSASGTRPPRARRGYKLTQDQELHARRRAREGAKIADVKRELAAPLVETGEWSPGDAVDGAPRNEALYRAVGNAMRHERGQIQAGQQETAALVEILTGSSLPVTSSNVVWLREASSGLSEGYEYLAKQCEYKTREQVIQASRLEDGLVRRFTEYLASRDRRGQQARVYTGSAEIEWDLYDPVENVLYEAKADAGDRFQIRVAIGQLFDYAYFGFSARGEPRPRLAVLLPSAPAKDIAALLASAGIGAAWADGERFIEAIP